MLLVLLEHEVQVAAHGIGIALLPVAIGTTTVGLEQANAATGAVEVPRFADADMVVKTARVLGIRPHCRCRC